HLPGTGDGLTHLPLHCKHCKIGGQWDITNLRSPYRTNHVMHSCTGFRRRAASALSSMTRALSLISRILSASAISLMSLPYAVQYLKMRGWHMSSPSITFSSPKETGTSPGKKNSSP